VNENGYFKFTDPHASDIMGHPIDPHWWSRHYEYPWALQYAEAGQVVADMGCGWMYRPFKDALAALGCKVYAVDGDWRVLAQEERPGIELVYADMTEPIEAIEEGSLDRIFCISVLEDLGDKLIDALKEFYRLLKSGGLCVLTFDARHNISKPLGRYPRVPIRYFQEAVKKSKLKTREKFIFDKHNALFHAEFNLCVFHCILTRP